MTLLGTLVGNNTIQTGDGTITLAMSYSASTGILGTSSNHSLDFRTNNTNSMRLVTSTNRLLVNTTTDAGYQLDVNGSIRTGSVLVTTGRVECVLTTQDLGQAALPWRTCFASTISSGGSSTTLTLGANLHGIQISSSGLSTGVAVLRDYNSGANSNTVLFSMDSTTRGVRFPRMTTAQRTAISSPPAGLMVYDTDLNHICFYDTSGAPGWRKLSYSNA